MAEQRAGWPPERLILWILGGLGIAVLFRTAWMSDDAYISYRVIENFLSGHGLRWNVVERVQVFTHPLWLFVIMLFRIITQELHFTAMFVSMAATIASVWIAIRRLATGYLAAITALVLLLCSKAFIDYSSSGLENPLSFVLVALLGATVFSARDSIASPFRVALLVALLGLNRLDLLLIGIPLLIVIFLQQRSWRTIRDYALGFSPLIFWFIFATVYYGFFFPNTYYAKTWTGVNRTDLVRQGLTYMIDHIGFDPATVLLIASGIASAFLFRGHYRRAWATGIILYLVYVVSVGGDFMYGRFLSVPVLASVILLVSIGGTWTRSHVGIAAAACVAISFLGAKPSYMTIKEIDRHGINSKGMVDERAFYFEKTGLLVATRDTRHPDHPWWESGRREQDEDQYIETSVIGFIGMGGGPRVHVVDRLGLSEPLLARMPVLPHMAWRIGHFQRSIPEGYRETIQSGINEIADSNLHLYIDHLWNITRGPIFSRERWQSIWLWHSGQLDTLMTAYLNRPPLELPWDSLSTPAKLHGVWNIDGRSIPPNGLILRSDTMLFGAKLEISSDHNDQYWVRFYGDGILREESRIGTCRQNCRGIRYDTIPVPETAQRDGFDAIEILPRMGDGYYSVGHVRVIEPSETAQE